MAVVAHLWSFCQGGPTLRLRASTLRAPRSCAARQPGSAGQRHVPPRSPALKQMSLRGVEQRVRRKDLLKTCGESPLGCHHTQSIGACNGPQGLPDGVAEPSATASMTPWAIRLRPRRGRAGEAMTRRPTQLPFGPAAPASQPSRRQQPPRPSPSGNGTRPRRGLSPHRTYDRRPAVGEQARRGWGTRVMGRPARCATLRPRAEQIAEVAAPANVTSGRWHRPRLPELLRPEEHLRGRGWM